MPCGLGATLMTVRTWILGLTIRCPRIPHRVMHDAPMVLQLSIPVVAYFGQSNLGQSIFWPAHLANPFLANPFLLCCVVPWLVLVWIVVGVGVVCFAVCLLFLVVVCCCGSWGVRCCGSFVWCLLLFVVVVVVRVGGVVLGLDHFAPDPPPLDRPNFRFFFPSPAPIFALFLFHCVSSR